MGLLNPLSRGKLFPWGTGKTQSVLSLRRVEMVGGYHPPFRVMLGTIKRYLDYSCGLLSLTTISPNWTKVFISRDIL